MKNFLKSKKTRFLLILILLLAAFLRLYGLDWDQGQHLHPDERFLTMVLTAIKIPNNFPEYLNPQKSPMSPYNNNFSFFVYGTFPLYLTKIIGVFTGNNDYGNIHFIGRILSALFDIGTVFLVYLIAKKIFSEKILNTRYLILNTPYLAAFLYAIMVLPIQLSHFFAVDAFLNFFLILSFYFLLVLLTSPTPNLTHLSFLTPTLLGISYGCALACKISALYFLPIIGLGHLFLLLFPNHPNTPNHPKIFKILVSFSLFSFFSLLSFRVSQPTTFSSGNLLNWQPNPQFINNLKELKNLSGSDSWYPPSVQWHSTKPIIFPLQNIILWGLGLPLGILSIAAIIYSLPLLFTPLSQKSLTTLTFPKKFAIFLVLLWIFGLFIYQGLQFCKTMRYFLPIYPFLAILTANLLSKLNIKFIIFIIIIIFIYPVSFLSIYSQPITRVSASKWIYENIPNGSTVTYEEWDDGLPLGLPNYPPANFKTESLMMYDFDTPEKWQKLNEKIAKLDYYFITSNRAYGSTMKLSDKYSQTTAFYQSLFNSTGDFAKVAEFTSYPCFPPTGKHWFCFNDDGSEEAFTVYDHPKVMIFRKK